MICVCANGDPLAARTWSGTARHITLELQRRGLLAGAINFDALLPKPAGDALKVASKLYYTGSKYVGHGVIQRSARSRLLARRVSRFDCKALLHMGTIALPYPAGAAPAGTHHYVLVDSSWNLWTATANDRDRISARLLRDGERLERAALHQATHVFTTAAYVRDNIIQHYGVPPERVTAVGTGRGTLAPDHGEKDYANGVILFVAKERFHDKGGHLLIEAFQLARETNPQLKLVIAGAEQHREYVPDDAAIEFHGFLSLEELQALFHRASLFALPALNEPWGLVYLESLACRVPVLGLERNALPELTANGAFGFYSPDESPAQLAATILRAFEDPAKLAAMGQAGQAHCLAQFTWEKTVDRMLSQVAAEHLASGR